MTVFDANASSDATQRAAAQRYAGISRDYSRLVCCSDGNFRPPIAAEAFERDRKGQKS